jgi:phosphatidylglycerophosphate synthase
VQISLVPAWVVAVIITREFLVTGLRSMAAAKGRVIPAGMWGKQKTFITLLAIGALLLAKGLGAHQLSLFPLQVAFTSQTTTIPELLLLLSNGLVILATIWTIFSGIEYMVSARFLFQSDGTGQP